jgi:hypothetical protein
MPAASEADAGGETALVLVRQEPEGPEDGGGGT